MIALADVPGWSRTVPISDVIIVDDSRYPCPYSAAVVGAAHY